LDTKNLFDHVVSGCEQRRRHGMPSAFAVLVDDELEVGRLNQRKFADFSPLRMPPALVPSLA
jgi:hypothetical protein